MKPINFKTILVVSMIVYSFVICQEETTVATTAQEEEEEAPQKAGCSIWCWIQKIAMFIISQLLSG